MTQPAFIFRGGYVVSGALWQRIKNEADKRGRDPMRGLRRYYSVRPDSVWGYLQAGLRAGWLFDPLPADVEAPRAYNDWTDKVQVHDHKRDRRAYEVQVAQGRKADG